MNARLPAIAAAIIVFVSCCCGARCAENETAATPANPKAQASRVPESPAPFAGNSIPVPPRQNTPWLPPDGVPAKWIDAARTLFSQGLADPRGCEYREIDVVAGSVWGGGGSVEKTKGWVLPRDPSWKQDFAVCWNGLVYPVLRVGAPADFRADAGGFSPRTGAANLFNRGEAEAIYGAMQTNANARGPLGNKLPVKCCLLLRLGEGGLAREAALVKLREERDVWAPLHEEAAKKAGKPVPPREEPVLDEKEDPYFDWASQWLWALWDRAVCAHMRGDDGLALASLRKLDPHRALVSNEFERRGIPHKTNYESQGKDKALPYFDWLRDPFPLLLADQERRAKTPKRPTVLKAGREKYPDQSFRISALIEDLQEVSVRQWGQPGGLEPYTGDPTVKALIDEGEAAIEPLLTAWEKDGDRLTRSVSFGRDFHPERYVHPVSGPIRSALAAIMHISPDDFRTMPGGSTSASVRAYWAKSAGTTPADRWFRVMADDDAGVKAWLQAAKDIVRPSNVQDLGNGVTSTMPLKPGEAAAMSGEALRVRKNPTLGEVWAKRVPQVTPAKFSSSMDDFALIDACEFLTRLDRWEPAAAQPLLAGQMRLCMQRAEHRGGMATGQGRRILDWFALFTRRRAEEGDLTALDEYCTWLTSRGDRDEGEFFEPRGWSSWHARENVRVLDPLWRFPAHPAVRAAVKQLFDNPTSPLTPLLTRRTGDDTVLGEIARTPLCRFPEVRSEILRALADKTNAGTAQATKDGQRTVGSASFRGDPPDVDMQLDTDVPYRVCDFFATQLTCWEGFPRLECTWPEAKRDGVVAEAAKRLREPGDFFDHAEPKPTAWEHDFPRW